VGNDTAECRVELVNHQTPVAGGRFKTGVATGASGWHQAVIDFTYVSGLTPDTLYILFSSSTLDYSPKAGSVLWIDDASVIGSAGVEQLFGSENELSIYPNPANSNVTIDFPEKATLEIINMEGQVIKSINADGNATTIDISGLANGVYFLKAKTEKGIVVKKLVKE
jgi:hypothetical protein